MAAADPVLVVENIVKRFETQDGVLTAVDDVSFNVVPGEFLLEMDKESDGYIERLS